MPPTRRDVLMMIVHKRELSSLKLRAQTRPACAHELKDALESRDDLDLSVSQLPFAALFFFFFGL